MVKNETTIVVQECEECKSGRKRVAQNFYDTSRMIRFLKAPTLQKRSRTDSSAALLNGNLFTGRERDASLIQHVRHVDWGTRRAGKRQFSFHSLSSQFRLRFRLSEFS